MSRASSLLLLLALATSLMVAGACQQRSTNASAPLYEECQFAHQVASPDSTWWRFEGKTGFSFLLPPELEKVDRPGTPIDSYPGSFESDSGFRLNFDYGLYGGGNPGGDFACRSIIDTTVAGRGATLVHWRRNSQPTAYRNQVAFHRPAKTSVNPDGDTLLSPRASLSMTAVCKTEKQCAKAYGIFESVELPY
jgi:hypothetical protein